MLVIRREQMQTLEAAQFTAWVTQHVQRFFPESCAKLGPAATAQAVADGLARAREYGFSEPADACRFVDMVFALGPEFDRDPALPWAAELLAADDVTDPTERMDLLTLATKNHLRAAG
jgi:hypothetical protein